MDENAALAAFSSISNATRLRILKCLVMAGPDGMSAGEVASEVEASPSRTSFHLSNLSEAGLVASSRQSRQITYRVEFETIGGLARYLLHDCCRNNSVVRACCVSDKSC